MEVLLWQSTSYKSANTSERSESVEASLSRVGGLKCMSLDTFVSIANALQVSADELLKDNIENNIKVANHEFASLIADCSEYEKRVLLSMLKTAKTAMRENRHLLMTRRK